MIDLSTLSLFLLAVLALFLSPGPNMAFVLSHGIAYGPRGGFAAALGIGAADLVHTLFAATGITAIVASWPPAFDLIRYAGAVYLILLAVQAIRSPGKAAISGCKPASMAQIFRMAMLNCLLNPKALLFFMVFLPQFVDAARGNVLLQIIGLGVTLSIAGVLFNTVLGAFSGQIGRFINRNPRAAKFQSRFLGGVLVSLAVRLILLDRPTGR
jgi:threonine/homoserine/homoserine lactone efflux protein